MTPTTTGPEPATRRAARAVLGWLGRVERRLRPDGSTFVDPEAVTSATSRRPRSDDTIELLRPNTTEPAASRARRQARAYLARRRSKLSEDLHRER